MRTLNRLLSLLLGLALAVAGVFVMIEVILAAAGESFVVLPARRWLGWLKATPWSAASVMAILSAMTLVGLILLVAELRPWRSRRMPAPVTGRGDWWLLRGSTERYLRRHLESKTVANKVRPTLSTRSGPWRVRLKVDAREGARPEIEQRTRAALHDLGVEQTALKVKSIGNRRP
ncbi:MAG TPA: hypothetical protein VH112_00255 [Acidimicrobiales bacterium]|jgi:hypothetical protein|nr:hypothetical protein [Acidimicrobiales bacterium]